MILGFAAGVVFVVLLVLFFAAGYVTAANKIKPLNEEPDLDDR